VGNVIPLLVAVAASHIIPAYLIALHAFLTVSIVVQQPALNAVFHIMRVGFVVLHALLTVSIVVQQHAFIAATIIILMDLVVHLVQYIAFIAIRLRVAFAI